MPHTPAKLVIVGLELGDAPLLHQWSRDGRLPVLQSLMQTGTWGWLETTANQLHISAWPSIYTGTTPGEHGVYFTFQPAPGLQGYQRFHVGLYGQPTFWHVLDAAGRRCTVLDPPYTHPEQGFKGTYVYDWGSWAHYLKTGSMPDGVLRNLERCCGRYPLGLEANDHGLAPLDPVDIQRRLIEAVKSKTAATRWLMQQSQWDVMFTVFGETHVGGHYCWTAHQPDNMLGLYQEIDRGIGAIREAAGPDASVIVVSGDSVGPNNAGWHLLPDILGRLGYLAQASLQASAPQPDVAAAPSGARFDPVKALRDMLPKEFRKSLARMLPTALRDKLAQRVDTADVDWSRTRAYCLPTDLEGYIRINLKGREPQGTVAPGAEYSALLEEIAGSLKELRDTRSGRRIVRDVLRTDIAFPGARRDYLPDLIVLWDNTAPISDVSSARLGSLSMASPDSRTGTHTGPGFVLASGSRIQRRGELKDGNIVDFAPTMLTLAGVDVPQHMRGRALSDLIAV